MSKRKASVFRPTAFAFPYLAVTLVFVIVPLYLPLPRMIIVALPTFLLDL